MKLRQLRLKTNHPHCYRPSGCETMTVGNVLWDAEKARLCVELIYDNGALDWYPLSELMEAHTRVNYCGEV